MDAKNKTGYIEHLENTHLGSDSTTFVEKVTMRTKMVVVDGLQHGPKVSLTTIITKTAFICRHWRAGTTINARDIPIFCVRNTTIE